MPLGARLKLSEEERMVIAMAYTYERDTAYESEPTNEREEHFVYLPEIVGVSEEETGRILEDADLSLTPPGTREGFEPGEAVWGWSDAEERLNNIAEAQSKYGIFGKNFGVDMFLWDATSRAGELLRRTKPQVEESAK